MAERRTKTPDEKLAELNKKMEQLQAQKKAIQQQKNKDERAARTRRLIENGTIAEKYFNCEKIEPADFENLLKQLIQIEQIKSIISPKKEIENEQ